MKKILFSIMALVAMGMAVSCSDPENSDNNANYQPDRGQGVAPVVVSVSPQDGAADLDTIKVFTIEYDKPIQVVPHKSIKINDEYVADSAITAEGNKLVFTYDTKGNKTYKVTVMKPTVRDEGYNFASDFTFSFSTAPVCTFDDSRFDIADMPVNADATAETVKLYQYLKSQFGKTVLSASVSSNEDRGWGTSTAEDLFNRTGKYPAIACFDYLFLHWSKPLGNANWIDYTDTTPVENWANGNGIVSIMWHWNMPETEADINNPEKYHFYVSEEGKTYTPFSCKNAVRSGKWENTLALKHLDVVADYLLDLQAKGISVLWRPLHEAAGNRYQYEGGTAWFWWGNDGAAQYKKLWKLMFDTFKAKGVNNLIWVWTSDGKDKDYYPGDEYVDIIGRDYYENDASKYHFSLISDFDALYNLTNGKKIITLSECGAVPEIGNMMQGGDMWSWFMPWNGDFMNSPYNDDAFFNAQMNSKYVISRDELPSWK